jgi:NitT/TauT family transport system ATP-binding protein
MVSLQNVTLSLRKQILNQSTLQFPTGKISVLLGPSGCGKSTILRVIANLLSPESGSIIRESDQISVVFQEPRLLSWLTVKENILLPFQISTTSERPSFSDALFEQVLREVSLENSGDLYPHQLSGGMKMRVAIARALITRPQILLMDEPFAALDEVTRFSLQDFLLSIQQRWQMTIIFVTHSFSEAVYLADRIFLLEQQGGQAVHSHDVSFTERNSSLRTSVEYSKEMQFWGAELRKVMRLAE